MLTASTSQGGHGGSERTSHRPLVTPLISAGMVFEPRVSDLGAAAPPQVTVSGPQFPSL